MVLKGDIDSFGVPELLRLAAAQHFDGRLTVVGERGDIAVDLRAGKLVAGEVDAAPTRSTCDAVVEMLRTPTGRFSLDSNSADAHDSTDTGNDAANEAEDSAEVEVVESVLLQAECLVGEWEEVEQHIPDLDRWVELSDTLADDTITMTTQRWAIVTTIGSGHTIRDLVATGDRAPIETARAIADLVRLGAARLTDAEAPAAAKRPSDTPPGADMDGDADVAYDVDANVAPPDLDELSVSLDRRLEDLGPPTGHGERRIQVGTILDARDLGSGSAG